jgi:serine/threonine protein kinase
VPEPAPQPTPAEFKPHVFGKFFLLQRLAIGGMAEIYRAKVVGAGGFEKEMVVKRILRERSQDQGFIRMLVNEARLTVQLTHNNVAQIYECGAVDGNYFIAMELVAGISLREMLQAFTRAGATLRPEQAIYLTLQLLQGLDYAHRKVDAQGQPLRIVHCDVSPDNALVSWEGELKLLDFGIARAATSLSNYKEGMLMGKLGYVAPEQASVEATWDHRVDVFAAGVILYELLTRQKPFPKAGDVDSLIASRKARVVPPSEMSEGLPHELDAILARALAYDPEQRYPRARDFAEALVDVLFPTPHSAIQDLLAQRVQEVFANRIARERASRAHDALVMKVLQHVAEQTGEKPVAPPAAEPGRLVWPSAPTAAPRQQQPPVTTDPLAEVEITFPARAASSPAASPPRRPSAPASAPRGSPWLAGAAGAGAGLALAAGAFAWQAWTRGGALVVTSDPPGAAITLDGARLEAVTPAVVERVPLARGHLVLLEAPGRRAASATLEPDWLASAARVHLQLERGLGPLRVTSSPPGAAVRIDDRPAGVTPLTIPDVKLDERHRIDLTLAGYELDQFVVLPAQDGASFDRDLARRDRSRKRP